ncbi:MAG: cytochrome c-type biogenesis protein CcmH [Acidobacteria bacterium]|nr:cytochrome c-type biogenesis protein CcmH [Acidobacteriota bacterium]
MGSAPRSTAAAFLLLLALGPGPGEAADPEAAEIAGRLVCYCGTCSNQTIRDCTCGTARSARADIQARLERGESEEAIVAFYTGRFGEQILIAPGTRGFNLVAWLTPFAALAAGGFGLVWVLRRWTAARPGPASRSARPAPDRRLLERLEREVRALDD